MKLASSDEALRLTVVTDQSQTVLSQPAPPLARSRKSGQQLRPLSGGQQGRRPLLTPSTQTLNVSAGGAVSVEGRTENISRRAAWEAEFPQPFHCAKTFSLCRYLPPASPSSPPFIVLKAGY